MMKTMPYLWVALGSALGGMLRYAISSMLSRSTAAVFPWATLGINTAGCFLIGYLSSVGLPPHLRLWLIPGFCGGFTTFSAFSLEFLALQRAERHLEAWGYVAASVFFCLVAVAAGAMLGRKDTGL
jgi:fluoride exporter